MGEGLVGERLVDTDAEHRSSFVQAASCHETIGQCHAPRLLHISYTCINPVLIERAHTFDINRRATVVSTQPLASKVGGPTRVAEIQSSTNVDGVIELLTSLSHPSEAPRSIG